jgi:hypothetical protein
LRSSKVIELVISIVKGKESKWIKLVVAVITGVLLIYVAPLGLLGTSINISKSGRVGGWPLGSHHGSWRRKMRHSGNFARRVIVSIAINLFFAQSRRFISKLRSIANRLFTIVLRESLPPIGD